MMAGRKIPTRKMTVAGSATKANKEKRLGHTAPSPTNARVRIRPATLSRRGHNVPLLSGGAADIGEVLI
jgi:hypothetical protein